MKTAIQLFLISCCILVSQKGLAALGDFRTKATGNWNQTSTWEYHNGSTWVNATWTPTSGDQDITILAGHSVTITAPVNIDQVTVKGTLTISSGISVTLFNGTGTDLYVDNLSSAYAYLNVYGVLINQGTLSKSDGVITFFNNSTYRHAQNGGTVEDISWNSNSNCEITGLTDDSSGPSNLDQTFGNFKWSCAAQSVSVNLATIPYITGNFTIDTTGSGILSLSTSVSETMTIAGNYTQTGGNFYPSMGSGDDIIYIGGDFYMDDGHLGGPSSGSGSTTLVFNKNGTQGYTYSARQGSVCNKLHFLVNSGSTLDVGTSIVGDPLYVTGNFSLSSGAGLRTANPSGIASVGATGSVQVMGTRTFSSGAHYTYYTNGTQWTGTGLPGGISGSVTIGSASAFTTLNFTNPVAINSTLIIINGSAGNSNLGFGSSAILEYRGASTQVTGTYDFPANAVPNLKINNAAGVILNSSKTVSSNLNLSNGEMQIGSGNTLTLNGTITRTSGSMNGHSDHTSNLLMGGSGNTSLPAISNGLNNLTLNRSGATISLTGNLMVYGVFDLSAGAFLAGGGVLTYGSSGTLMYSGAYTTSNSEFPSSSGPFNLVISNNVNLHADRTLNGNFALNSGQFSIGAHLLTLNGSLTRSTGILSGGTSSDMMVGGAGSTPVDLPAVSLRNLTLNRSSSGIRLIGNITITGTMNMTGGSVNVNGNIFSYASSASCLRYNGISAQVTADGEFPSENGPYSLIISNEPGVSLHADRTINGALNLLAGKFSIGANILALLGPPISGNPLNLITSDNSGLVFGGSFPGIQVPSGVEQLSSLVILNSAGVTLSRDLYVAGYVQVESTLNMQAFEISGPGLFSLVPGGKLIIGHPTGVAGNIRVTGSLSLDSYSDYEFSGDKDQETRFLPTTIPRTVRSVIINKKPLIKTTLTEDITLTGNLDIMHPGTFAVDPDKLLTVMGNVTIHE